MSNIDEEISISGLLDQQAAAIRQKDIDGAIENYAPDVLIFDVVGPLAQPRGIHSVKSRLEQWFATFEDGGDIGFEITDREITATMEIAFSHTFNHVTAALKNGGQLDMYWRETLGWKLIDFEWRIVHAHSSVPFDATTGLASTGLKPVN